MGDPVDLTKQPIFVAKEIYCFDDVKGYYMAIGEEDPNNCSFYTNVVIIKGPIAESDNLQTLREALLEKLKESG